MTDASRVLKVRHKDRTATVYMVHRWSRGDIDQQTMSNSAGPKDYIKNQIFAVFAGNEAIDHIAMVVSNSVPFLILISGRRCFDVRGVEIEVSGGMEL